MEERNNDKAKAKIALQAQFNEKNKKSKGKWLINSKWIFHILVQESLKIQRNQIFKRVRETATRMVAKRALDMKRESLTRARCNVTIIKSLVIVHDNAMRTRKNLKQMKLRLQ